MNVKSLLLGSAAAFAAASGAQAADPVVVVEPIAPNYVEVCDAFGAGFFYIPGTETCLDIGGYVRFQVFFEGGDAGHLDDGDWGMWTRGHLEITSKTDTELGVATGFISLNAQNSSNSYFEDSAVKLDETYLALGNFQAGYFNSYWDEGMIGEVDNLSGNTKFNSMRYYMTAGGFLAGLSVDALTSSMIDRYADDGFTPSSNHVGVSGRVAYAAGGVSLKLDGGYDTYNEEGALRLMTGFDLGPGEFQLGGTWASGWGAYATTNVDEYFGDGSYSDWAIAAGYALDVTDSFRVTPQFQYTWVKDAAGPEFGSESGFKDSGYWLAGVYFEYEIVDGFAAKLNVNYMQADNLDNDNLFGGWFRLQRDF